MAIREVPWPRSVAAVASSLSCAKAWFWLDGEADGGRTYLGQAAEMRHAQPGQERQFLTGLRAATQRSLADGDGWLVVLSYEFGVALMGEPVAEESRPPALAMRADAVLVLDHGRGRAELHGTTEASIDAWLQHHGSSLVLDEDQRTRTPPPAPPRQQPPSLTKPGLTQEWRRSDAEYLRMIEACQASIRDGDAYVLCLTDTVEVREEALSDVARDPLELYLRLRATAHEIRGAVIVAPEWALVSTSPERFLSVQGDRVETHPIKGTRPRGGSLEEDTRLARELAADPKERAENLMIVDLMRNELSRVCVPSTVTTKGFLRVETHARVHQLVSTVSGELRPEVDAIDALEACFPGGSMTGAPKRRAVELLGALEAGPRGLYSGCFGWLAGAREMELAMTIRAVELTIENGLVVRARVGAGGGITADSEPQRELDEKHLKASALLGVLTSGSGRYS